MEMRTVCRVPGLVDALRRFRGGSAIRASPGSGVRETQGGGLLGSKCRGETPPHPRGFQLVLGHLRGPQT